MIDHRRKGSEISSRNQRDLARARSLRCILQNLDQAQKPRGYRVNNRVDLEAMVRGGGKGGRYKNTYSSSTSHRPSSRSNEFQGTQHVHIDTVMNGRRASPADWAERAEMAGLSTHGETARHESRVKDT